MIFLSGVLLGAVIGIIAMCLCQTAGEADDRNAQWIAELKAEIAPGKRE